MSHRIFVNLPVKNLKRTVAFFTDLGFSFNRRFSDERATCMIVGENIFVMLLVDEFFSTFTGKPVNDTAKTNEVLICLSATSREEVDHLVARAFAAGATPISEAQDQGFMYSHGFCDPDGHVWELMWMDVGGNAEF